MIPSIISLLLLLAGLPLAWAGVEVARTVGVDMIGSLAWAHAIVSAMIAAWSGMAATLGRKLAAKKAGQPFFWLDEVLRDGFVSVTIGAAGYWLGSAQGLTSMQVGTGLLVGGYAGVRALDWAADKWFGAKQPPGA